MLVSPVVMTLTLEAAHTVVIVAPHGCHACRALLPCTRGSTTRFARKFQTIFR